MREQQKTMIELRDCQLDAIKKMKNGCVLCGDVGSGKSRTALAYYYQLMGGKLNTSEYIPMKEPKDLYIITTAKKRDTLEWESEMVPFLLSSNPEVDPYDHTVVVDSWNNVTKYQDVTDAFFIFDEQRVVGYGAWTKAFLKIAKSNQWILLSATPGDTWTDYIPVFIANGFYKNKTEFNRNHCVFSRHTQFPMIERYLDIKRLERLRDRILVDIDDQRETITHHEDVYVDYLREKYKQICKDRWNPFQDKPIENASEFCYSLRRLINSDPSRELAVLEIWEKHPRLIIFYSFDYELEILKNLAEANGVEYAEWNGHKHQPIPLTGSWFYLVQYTAGAEGWNCVATDTIVFYSQHYSYKITAQASGRINRLNTPYKELYYYHLKSYAGIDLAIARALKNKKKFNERRFYGD